MIGLISTAIAAAPKQGVKDFLAPSRTDDEHTMTSM
jgi:hypothetical protein